jgi:hypothetical protein
MTRELGSALLSLHAPVTSRSEAMDATLAARVRTRGGPPCGDDEGECVEKHNTRRQRVFYAER